MRPRCHASSAAGSSRQGKRANCLAQRMLGGVGEVVEQVMPELAPSELTHEGAGGPAQAGRGLVTAGRRDRRLELEAVLGEALRDALPHLRGRDLAPVQVRREA